MAAEGGAEDVGRIRRSLQKLDLPDWYKRSSAGSREKLLSGSPSPSGRPRWSEWRQRSTSASSLGPSGDWSANSSFKRFSTSASGRQSKESLSPMSPSSVSGMPAWYGGHASGQRPHSAFNCYSYHHAGYSSASVSRCSSSRSTSPSALVGPPPLLRSPYRQPYLGWRSSEKLAREHGGVGNPTSAASAYHYRSPAERLSKGPGYYAFKFGMYAQTSAQGGSYVRQMVQEIERANQQQQKQTTASGSHQGRSQVTVNVIGPSPSELQPDAVDQVEDMVRQIDELIVQNGGEAEVESAEPETEDEEEENVSVSQDLSGSESFKPCVWMESSFVGTKPTSGSSTIDAEDTSGEVLIDFPRTSVSSNADLSGFTENVIPVVTSGSNSNADAISGSGKNDLVDISGSDFKSDISGSSKNDFADIFGSTLFDASGFKGEKISGSDFNVMEIFDSGKNDLVDVSGFTNNDNFVVSDTSGSRENDFTESSGFANVFPVSETSARVDYGAISGSGLVTSADVHDVSAFLDDDLPVPVFDEPTPEEARSDDEKFRLEDVIKAQEDFRLDDAMNHSSSSDEHAQPISTTQSHYQTDPEANERKFSLSTVELDDVLDSLLALPSTSSSRTSPCSRFLPPPTHTPPLPVWPAVAQAQLQVPSAPPLEPEEEEEATEEEEEGSEDTSTCGSSTGSGSPSGCSSVSSVSRTAACTSATSSSSTSASTSCSHPSCHRHSSSAATDRKEEEEAEDRPETTATTTTSHTLSTAHSTDDSTLNNEEPLSEGSSFPPPPGASELQQMMCLYEEASGSAPCEQPPALVTDEQEQEQTPPVGRVRRFPRPEHMDSLSLVRCSRGGCEREMELREARQQFKTCHNCYTFYCSRDCRKEHWELHRASCMYGRVRSLCKQALQYSRENEAVLHGLTKIARTGLLTQGPGFVKLLFRNTDTAIRYLREGRPQLEDGPIYVGWRNFLPEEMGDEVYRVVVQLCQNYDPSAKFILVVAVFVTREVPLRTVPHWEREIIAKCAKISLAKNGAAGEQDYLNNTLVLSGPSDVSCLGLSERESRLACLDNISSRLEEHGVSLQLAFPDVYHRLWAYVDLDEPFAPITIYPRDARTGSTFMCVIMPNTNAHHPPLPPPTPQPPSTTQPIN